MMEWKPIETAPRDGTEILLTDCGGAPRVFLGRFIKKGKRHDNDTSLIAQHDGWYSFEADRVYHIDWPEKWAQLDSPGWSK